MISLIAALARLSVVIALLIWLPGWIASGRRFWPPRALHDLLLGSALHVIALAAASFVTPRVDRALWLVPILTYAAAFAMRVVVRRAVPGGWEPPTLDRRNGAVMATLVALAASLRYLHNYHFDDLQHLRYLTEVQRQNALFPSEFMLALQSLTAPGLGHGSLMLSRYPFWAASYTLLGTLSGVAAGDVYFLIGLGILALVLGLTAAMVARAWSRGAATFWILAVVASGPFLSDSLLNYGGYPFQAGKLFVLLAATAALATWRSRRGSDLVVAACGLLIGPLLHTNNAVGVAGVIALLAPLALVDPRVRKGATAAMATLGLLVVLGLGSMVTQGFVRFMPDSALTDRVPSTRDAPPITVASIGQTAGEAKVERDPVMRRAALFAARGLPMAIFVVMAGLGVARALRPWPSLERRALFAGVAVAAVLVLGAWAADGLRQVVTTALKPGYLRQRDALRAVTAAIDPSRALLTDPITDVFGRAAGWRLPSAPALDIEEQSLPVLALHPSVTGGALQRVLDSVGPATIVVNEQVIGAGVSAKFEATGAARAARWGGSPPDAAVAARQVERVLHAIDTVDTAELASSAPGVVRDMLALLWARPVTVFVHDGARTRLDTGALGALIRAGEPEVAVPWRVEPFMSSALVTVPAPASCVEGLSLTLRNRASFDSAILLWPLDEPAAGLSRGTEYRTLGLTGSSATMPIAFDRRVCEAGPMTVLVHAGYWWDFRFDVDAAGWALSRQGR